MLRLKKIKEKGISLIELLLIVGLSAIIIIIGIQFWENQRSKLDSSKANNLLVYLGKTLKTSFAFSNQEQFNAGTLDNTTVQNVVKGILGESGTYANNTFKFPNGGILTATYGGLLVPNVAQNKTFGLQLSLTSVVAKDCAKIVSGTVYTVFSQIRVNGAVTLDIKGIPSPAELQLLVAACNTGGNNNTIRVDLPMNEIFNSDNIIITDADANVRTMDSDSFLGSVIDSSPLASGAAACTGGSTWYAASNRCGCPANTRWMGATLGCVPFNTFQEKDLRKAGVCNLNDGLSQTTSSCAVPTNSVPVAAGTFFNGKIIPSHSSVGSTAPGNVAPTSVGTPVVNAFHAVAGSTEEIAGRIINQPAQIAGQPYTNSCVNGSMSNNRCIPPATATSGNW